MTNNQKRMILLSSKMRWLSILEWGIEFFILSYFAGWFGLRVGSMSGIPHRALTGMPLITGTIGFFWALMLGPSLPSIIVGWLYKPTQKDIDVYKEKEDERLKAQIKRLTNQINVYENARIKLAAL